MAIYHCSVKNIGRSQGRSAIASASYRSGERLHSDETDRIFDYTNKSGIVHSEIRICKNAPVEFADRETLWNAVQKIENKADSRLAREIEFALPNELPLAEQIEICRSIADEFTAEGMCVDFAIHHPDKAIPNDHCHMMLTCRGIDEKGQWKNKAKKVYANDLNKSGKPFYNPEKTDSTENRIPVIDKKTGEQKIGAKGRRLWERVTIEDNAWDKAENVEKWRKMVADKINEGLENNGLDERVDHHSLKEQGIDREPTIHEGATARKMETKGKVAERCQINREIKARNEERTTLANSIDKLKNERVRALFAWYTEAKNNYLWMKPKLEKGKQLKKDIQKHNEWMDDVEYEIKQIGYFKVVPKELRERYQNCKKVDEEYRMERKSLYKEVSERFGVEITKLRDMENLYEKIKKELDKVARKASKPDSQQIDNPVPVKTEIPAYYIPYEKKKDNFDEEEALALKKRSERARESILETRRSDFKAKEDIKTEEIKPVIKKTQNKANSQPQRKKKPNNSTPKGGGGDR